MRFSSGALISALANNSVFLVANCYTITLQSGTVYQWTSADLNIVLGARTFTCTSDNSASQPVIKRGPIRHARGKQVETCELTLFSGMTVLIGGIPLPLFAHNGGFDSAKVLVEWVPMGPGGWGDTSLGSVVLFQGKVADVAPSTTGVKLNVKSSKEKLTLAQMPRTVFQSSCANAFGDSNCGKSLAGLTVTTPVTGGASSSGFTASGLAQAAGYFNLGMILFTTGVCAGASRAIYAHGAGGVLALVTPLPATPGLGDTFQITPGCDKQWSTCQTKFSNGNQYRGCPWVPAPITAL